MLDTVISRTALNDQQFGSTAALYLQSPVHSAGEDLKQLAAMAGRYPAGRVIDLGCGGGHVSYAAAPCVASVTAYDLSIEMLATVEADAKKRGLANIVTAQGGAETLPFADASFDVVLTRLSTHHWPDVRRGLREARRVLSAGGIAAISDVVAPELPVLDTFLQAIEIMRDPSHVRDYSISEWTEIAAQAGFAVTGITRRRLPLDFPSWVARQRTPEVQVAALRALFAAVPTDVRSYFDIRENDDFTIDSAVIELAPL